MLERVRKRERKREILGEKKEKESNDKNRRKTEKTIKQYFERRRSRNRERRVSLL